MSKRKFIVFDSDNSMASIGSIGKQKEVFGVQPRKITGGIPEIQAYLAKLVVKREALVKDDLDDLLGTSGVKQIVYELNDKAKAAGIDGIIIDTLSTIGFQSRKLIQGAAPALEMRQWGIYGDQMMRFINILSGLNIPVIVTCHLGVDKRGFEMKDGTDVPDLKGSSKLEVARYFDFIVYTSVQRSKQGKAKYLWQVSPDEKKIFAKDRLGTISGTSAYIDQNLAPILNSYEEAGIVPKILIIGDSGQGKTYSLATINN